MIRKSYWVKEHENALWIRARSIDLDAAWNEFKKYCISCGFKVVLVDREEAIV